MKITYEQQLLTKLKQKYNTNALHFGISRLGDTYTPSFMKEVFFNDSETQRFYGYYLWIHNSLDKTNAFMPYCPGMSFPLLETLIDSLINIPDEPETMESEDLQ